MAVQEGAFAALDEALAAQACRSGTTALALLQCGRQLVLANCGDSRAVLSNHGKARPLTSDHKPCSDSELARVTAAGASPMATLWTPLQQPSGSDHSALILVQQLSLEEVQACVCCPCLASQTCPSALFP